MRTCSRPCRLPDSVQRLRRKMRLTRATHTHVLLLNAGLHDIDKYCCCWPHWRVWRASINMSDPYDCIDPYRRNLKKLFRAVLQHVPQDRLVFFRSSTPWLRWGNVGGAWSGPQMLTNSAHSVRLFNDVARQVIAEHNEQCGSAGAGRGGGGSGGRDGDGGGGSSGGGGIQGSGGGMVSDGGPWEPWEPWDRDGPLGCRVGWIDGNALALSRPDHTERRQGGHVVHYDWQFSSTVNALLLQAVAARRCPAALASRLAAVQ